jgi:putative ABC transport system permease protein
MGVQPLLGRAFTAAEDQPGSERVVVLSHRLWTRRFGASASVIGHSLRMNGVTYQVVGVMPESFDLTTDSEDLWTRRQAQSELDAVAARLRHDFPKDDETVSFGTAPFVERFVGDFRQVC